MDKKTFEKLARMSAIHFSEKEKERFMKELDNIEVFLNKLDEVDLDVLDIALTATQKGKEREDIPEDPLSREEALKNVAEVLKGYIKIPSK